MAKSNAMKRLERILADEDYGPKLARLNRADERRVLDLIEQNPDGRGQAARKEILRLDEARLSRERARRQSKKSSVPVIDIEVLRRRAYANMRRQVNGKPATITRGVEHMTEEELEFAASASHGAIRQKAGDRSNLRVYEDLDFEINVFWYK